MSADRFERELLAAIRDEAYRVRMTLDAATLRQRLPERRRWAPGTVVWRLAAVATLAVALAALIVAAPHVPGIAGPEATAACEVSEVSRHGETPRREIGGPRAFFGTGPYFDREPNADSLIIFVRLDPPLGEGEQVIFWTQLVDDDERVPALLADPAEVDEPLPGAYYLVQQPIPAPGCWRLVAAIGDEVVGTAVIEARPTPPRTLDPDVPTPGLPSISPSPPSLTPSVEAPTPAPTPPLAPGTWRKLPETPIEDGLEATGVWTGEEFIVWGSAGTVEGAAYSPASDEWRAIARGPALRGDDLRAVWTGEEAIVWDGHAAAAYHPASDSWRRLPDAPVAGDAYGAGVEWSGSVMLVLTTDMQAAAYDPASDAWRALPSPPLPAGSIISAWTGTEWLVLGMGAARREPVPGAAFDPVTATWRALSASPLETTDEGVEGVWIGDRLVVVRRSPIDRQAPSAIQRLAYDPDSDTWEIMEIGDCGTIGAVWTGQLILSQFSALDPVTGECWTLPPAPVRDGWSSSNRYAGGAVAWTGTEFIVWGGSTGGDIDTAPADGAAFRLR